MAAAPTAAIGAAPIAAWVSAKGLPHETPDPSDCANVTAFACRAADSRLEGPMLSRPCERAGLFDADNSGMGVGREGGGTPLWPGEETAAHSLMFCQRPNGSVVSMTAPKQYRYRFTSPVTGHIKTSQSRSLQNQPRFDVFVVGFGHGRKIGCVGGEELSTVSPPSRMGPPTARRRRRGGCG